jgi:DNA helicase HerA-like ATPase
MIYQKFTKYKTQKAKGKYIIFAIEEAHNYIPNNALYKVGAGLAKKKLHLIATQGRKFGIGLCLISQRPAFLDDVVVSMINSFFIHRVAFDDVSFVRKVTGGLSKTRENKLTTLPKGHVIVTGQMSNRLPIPLTIKVSPGKDRKIPHTFGTTYVIDGLLGDFETD